MQMGKKSRREPRVFKLLLNSLRATYSPPVRILGTRIRALCLVGIAKVEILLIRRTVPSTVLSQDSRDKGHMPIERTASDAF